MKANFSRLVLTLALVIPMANAALAAPIDRRAVPSNPSWVAHLDCDALRATQVGQYLLADSLKPENQARYQAFEMLVGIDPRKALHGITLYGNSPLPDDGIAIVYADFDASRLTALAQSAQEPSTEPHGPHSIYGWLKPKQVIKTGLSTRSFAAIHGNRVIFAQKADRLAEALDVLDNLKPNLASTSLFPKIGAAGEPGIFQMARRKHELDGTNLQTSFLKQSKAAFLQTSETQGRVVAALDLQADSPEIAQQLAAIARGMVAILGLQKDRPLSLRLAQTLKVEQNGPDIRVDLNLPSSDLIELLKTRGWESVPQKTASIQGAPP